MAKVRLIKKDSKNSRKVIGKGSLVKKKKVIKIKIKRKRRVNPRRLA